MKILWIASALLVAKATTALAQQPAVYPLRSQSAAQQGVDSAYCYWQAKRQTGVNMARQSQRPEATHAIRFGADAGRGASEPPLPAPLGASSSVSHTPKVGATGTEASGAPAASDVPGLGAQSKTAAANGRAAQGAAPASSASGSMPASTSPSVSGTAGLPPLPPPPPPMTSYWQAYGDCMQARGYGVQ
ncbi:hypothetical protein [Trinickia sp.]|uniref:hypothetical protein n=1 Tax=Trinickia sp. TaxID=2571163 RepID=UPI003F823793